MYALKLVKERINLDGGVVTKVHILPNPFQMFQIQLELGAKVMLYSNSNFA